MVNILTEINWSKHWPGTFRKIDRMNNFCNFPLKKFSTIWFHHLLSIPFIIPSTFWIFRSFIFILKTSEDCIMTVIFSSVCILTRVRFVLRIRVLFILFRDSKVEVYWYFDTLSSYTSDSVSTVGWPTHNFHTGLYVCLGESSLAFSMPKVQKLL